VREVSTFKYHIQHNKKKYTCKYIYIVFILYLEKKYDFWYFYDAALMPMSHTIFVFISQEITRSTSKETNIAQHEQLKKFVYKYVVSDISC
jgi:hypothetical protein